MNKLVYFLVVGLAFTVLQVSTVSAQTGAPGAPMCDSNPACDPSDPAANCCAGMCDPNPACVMDDPNAIPCCGPMDGPPGQHDGPPGMRGQHDGPPPGDSCMTVPAGPDRDACYSSMSGSSMPPGGHHDGPPIDPRSGQPFTKADEDKYQKYADECEATRGLLSEGSTQELVAEGFTRLQVEKLCKDGPDHHDGPPGGPDGHHDGPPGMPPQ